MDEVATDTLMFVAQNANVQAARDNIRRWAHAYGLRLDAIEQRRRRFTTELAVTVTGPRRQIEGFREELAGDAWASTVRSPLDIPIAGALTWITRSLQRWRRAHSKRNSP